MFSHSKAYARPLELWPDLGYLCINASPVMVTCFEWHAIRDIRWARLSIVLFHLGLGLTAAARQDICVGQQELLYGHKSSACCCQLTS